MWTDSSVFYQIYPLGAFGAPFENDGKTESRILGLQEYVPSLKELGVDAILFNPLFESKTHGYDTTDYRKVDVRLGTNEDLKAMVDLLHENGIKVIVDAVFNHVGRDFPPFVDLLQNREHSRYKDWFQVNFGGNNSYNDGLWYANWEGYDALVKLNLQNPEVVQYILDTVTFWKNEFGIDGLRLDVAYCLDLNFLKALRHHAKSLDPDFFLLGETLHGDYNRWVNEEMLDSCTNYECYKGLYSALNSKNLFEIVHSLNRQFGPENWCLYTGKHLLNFVDNHDVERISSILNKKEYLPLIYTLLFGMPGIPCIYYGSEWGIEGKKNHNDTSLRPHIEKLESNELTEFIKKLIEIKHEYTCLHNGNYRPAFLQNETAVIERSDNQATLWFAVNLKEEPVMIHQLAGGVLQDLIEDKTVDRSNGLLMEPLSAKVFKV
jgi:glycosidase